MSIADVIKRKKKRKIIKEQKIAKKIEDLDRVMEDGTTAETWDWKRQNPRLGEDRENYRKRRESKKKARKVAREPAMEGVSKQAESKPAKRLKRAEPEKPTSEFMEKYYGKDWA